MRSIGILRLLLFCGHFTAALVDVILKSNTLTERIWITWNQLINNEFNPDDIYNTPKIIRNAGYPAESYVIMTKDGYLLTLHRIPGGNGSSTVLLQHGFLGNSVDWVSLGKNKALAYLLADQGYDVWLGNFRGNIHSRAHISLSPTNSKFWDFGLNELGIYDLPAMITFITKMTSQPLHTYIGYSMGTTSFYIMASQRPEIAQVVQMMISLAPTAFVSHVQSPLRFLVPFRKVLKIMKQFFFHDEFLQSVRLPAKYDYDIYDQDFAKNERICANMVTRFSSGSEFLQSDLIKFIFMYICDQKEEILRNLIFIIYGYDYEQFNYNVLSIFFNYDSSAKTLIHYIQGYQSGKFRHYDYGPVKNLMIYNSTEPLDYDLTNITTPIALMYSDTDSISNTKDVKRLRRELPNVVDMYEVPWPYFNHADFLWLDASKLVYERVLKIIEGRI